MTTSPFLYKSYRAYEIFQFSWSTCCKGQCIFWGRYLCAHVAIVAARVCFLREVFLRSNICFVVWVIFFHRKGFWLNKIINQTSGVMLRKCFCVKNLYCTSYIIIAGTFKQATVQNSQLIRAEPREVKKNSKISKTNGKSMKHSYLSPR